MTYAIIKAPGSGYLIDDGSGTSIRYKTKREAELTIARWERNAVEVVAYKAERDRCRREIVMAYLEYRAARRVEAAKQFAFNF